MSTLTASTESVGVSRPADIAARSTPVAWTARWTVMLVIVYAASVIVTLRPIVDPDIWWHLRTGQWVVMHRAVPFTDPFSTYGADHPWVAYSWLFGVLMYALHSAFGLMGVVAYVVLGGLAVTSALLLLVMRFEHRVPRALALVAVGVGGIGPVLMPRAYLFTICCFVVELYVLFSVRETGRTRRLWILPVVFAFWANVHIQFVHGLLVMGMVVAESLAVALARRHERGDLFAPEAVPLRPALLATVACTLATLATPYGIAIYRPIVEHTAQRGAYQWIIELAAPNFRQPANWVFLALALGAAFMLGRQRRVQIFPLLLMLGGAYFSFLAIRDMWFLGTVAVAIIAMGLGDRRVERPRLPSRAVAGAVLGVAVVLAGVATARHLSPATLEAAVAREFPVAAVATVKAERYPGPLYNTFDWGGFLIWTLPEHPVSIDGRANLHGDQRLVRSLRTWLGRAGWDTDPELRAARLVILPRDAPLTELLRREPRVDLVYQDEVAAVFVRRHLN